MPSGSTWLTGAFGFLGLVSYFVYKDNKDTKERQIAGRIADQERLKIKLENRRQQEESLALQQKMEKLKAEREDDEK